MLRHEPSMMPPLRLLLSLMLVALVAYTGACVPGFVGAQLPRSPARERHRRGGRRLRLRPDRRAMTRAVASNCPARKRHAEVCT
jgi:hypothetical protein